MIRAVRLGYSQTKFLLGLVVADCRIPAALRRDASSERAENSFAIGDCDKLRYRSAEPRNDNLFAVRYNTRGTSTSRPFSSAETYPA
jgi:hypothetical protein